MGVAYHGSSSAICTSISHSLPPTQRSTIAPSRACRSYLTPSPVEQQPAAVAEPGTGKSFRVKKRASLFLTSHQSPVCPTSILHPPRTALASQHPHPKPERSHKLQLLPSHQRRLGCRIRQPVNRPTASTAGYTVFTSCIQSRVIKPLLRLPKSTGWRHETYP